VWYCGIPVGAGGLKQTAGVSRGAIEQRSRLHSV